MKELQNELENVVGDNENLVNTSNREVRMPNIIGKSIDDVKEEVSKEELKFDINTNAVKSIPQELC